MMLAVLLLSLCLPSPDPSHWRWNRLQDPDLASYRIEVAYLDTNNYPCQITQCEPGCDSATPGCCVDVPGMCVAYTLSSWSTAAVEQQVPGTEADVCTEWDAGLPSGALVPPLGAVLFVNVRGVDFAGNVGD